MAAIAADVDIERSLRSSATGTTRLAADGGGRVPVIDMSRSDAAEAMWDAATSVGFFTVVNHGVPDDLIENAFASSKQFFARDLDAKQRESPFAPQLNSGFEYFSQIRPSTGTADQKESLQITARAGAMDGRWPSEPEALQPVARAMMEASKTLAARILDMLEPRACPNLAPGTLQKSHTLWGPGGQCTLRLLHYPPTAPPEAGSNLWRAGPHTDWCCVTLLYQLPGHEGLECAANPRAGAGQSGWLRVDPVAGGVAVNIGDMLSHWAVWKSNSESGYPENYSGDLRQLERHRAGAGMEATSRRWRGAPEI